MNLEEIDESGGHRRIGTGACIRPVRLGLSGSRPRGLFVLLLFRSPHYHLSSAVGSPFDTHG